MKKVQLLHTLSYDKQLNTIKLLFDYAKTTNRYSLYSVLSGCNVTYEEFQIAIKKAPKGSELAHAYRLLIEALQGRVIDDIAIVAKNVQAAVFMLESEYGFSASNDLDLSLKPAIDLGGEVIELGAPLLLESKPAKPKKAQDVKFTETKRGKKKTTEVGTIDSPFKQTPRQVTKKVR